MRFTSVVRLVVLCSMMARGVAQSPAYESDPRYLSAIKDANEALRSRQYNFVVEAYKKANKVAGGQCVMCLKQAYDWQMKMGNYKDAAALAQQRVELMKTPMQKSMAEDDQAYAVLRMAGDKPKPEKLEAVHALYQAALTEYPKNLTARYADACLLAKMGKMDDASKEFSACAEAASPTDPTRMRAVHFAENPALSLHTMAPAFTVTALDGSKFTLDEMNGKVVLIDFWATWCGPCNEELPHMRKIAKEFAGQPLVIISVSWDADEAKWKEFLTKNEMTWVQYRDADHALSKKFGVEAIPHYFTIDSDGVLTAEMLGSGSDVEGKLKKLIARAKVAPAKTAVAVGN
jgi:thiol-disulfide isomerase/thioredoxin